VLARRTREPDVLGGRVAARMTRFAPVIEIPDGGVECRVHGVRPRTGCWIALAPVEVGLGIERKGSAGLDASVAHGWDAERPCSAR